MRTPRLSCPYAEYRAGMRIWCTRTDGLCVHVYFCQLKGWWALNPNADRCPVREEETK